MRKAFKRKISLADVAVIAAPDLFGWFGVLFVFGKFWKVGLIVLAVVAIIVAIVGMISGFLILWTKHWDI